MAKILAVDDDADFLHAVRVVLESEGFEVETATTPAEGIDKATSIEPDLVILDVLMPAGYEGFEVARAIREECGLTELPILILSAVHTVKKVPYRFAPDVDYLPVDVFVDKPVQLHALVETITNILGEQRAGPEHPL